MNKCYSLGVAANASNSSLNGENFQEEQPKIMLEKLKAKADVGAPMRFISRTSWLHKTMLVMLTASLAQVGYSDWNCGNWIPLVTPPAPCAGGVETIHQSYDQCGGRDFGSHVGCVNATITLTGYRVTHTGGVCNTAVTSILPAPSITAFDAARTYSCAEVAIQDPGQLQQDPGQLQLD